MKRAALIPFSVMSAVIAAACGDGVTTPLSAPSTPSSSSRPSLVVESAPVTVTHGDSSYQSESVSVARSERLFFSQPAGRVVVSVPKFDPTLGTLLSARLAIDGWLASDVLSHAEGPGYVSSSFRAGFGADVVPDAVVGSLIGVSSISFRHDYSGFDEDAGALASVERREDENSTYRFDRTYHGPDAAPFIADGSASGQALSLRSDHQRFFGAGPAEHSGLALASLLEIKTDPQPGTKPGIGTLILVVATLINDLDEHGLFTFSDLHAAGAAQFNLTVTYQYQPNRPPDCSTAGPSVARLWPPNHKMVTVEVIGVTDPDGDPVAISIQSVRQDEPTDTRGDGSFTPDAVGLGSSATQLRAERRADANGRVYHIEFVADDGRGGTCSATVLVEVPHDRRAPVVDEGPTHDSTT